MTTLPAREPMANAALKAGLIAGLLDAIAASIQSYITKGLSPVDVFKYVASGAFGSDVKTGNAYSWAAAGLVFHFLIAIAFAFFFFATYRYSKAIISNAVLAGVVYGLLVWCVMNLVVVTIAMKRPISAIKPDKAAIAAGILIAAIGIPISLLANRYYSKKVQEA